MKAHHVAFIRRVVSGEIYTGTSGTALAQWAVDWWGVEDEPRDYPRDRSDFDRCMNVYWGAPDDLKLRMRPWLERLGFTADFSTPATCSQTGRGWGW